jgi:hypothetical protein
MLAHCKGACQNDDAHRRETIDLAFSASAESPEWYETTREALR